VTHQTSRKWLTGAEQFAMLVETGAGVPLEQQARESDSFQMLLRELVIERGLDADASYCEKCRLSHDVVASGDGGYVWICRDGAEPVAHERVWRWRCNWRNLAEWIAKPFGLVGSIRHVREGQVAFLGELGKREDTVPVWLVRGLGSVEYLDDVLRTLETASPRRAGVVLSPACKPHLTLPNGSCCLCLGSFVDPDKFDQRIQIDEVWRAAFGSSRVPAGRRGNPGKPGDPVAELKERVRKGEALKRIGIESKAIQKLEKARFGRGNELSETDISNKIRVIFNAWKAAGYPRDYFDPE